jgi:hypothetical protein
VAPHPGSFEPLLGTCVVVVEFAVGVIVDVVDRAGCLHADPATTQEGGPGESSAGTDRPLHRQRDRRADPIVAGLLSRLRVPQVVILIVWGGSGRTAGVGVG